MHPKRILPAPFPPPTGSFKDYSKRHGLKFVCGPCADGVESDVAQPSSVSKLNGTGEHGGNAQENGASSSPPALHPGTNPATASRTGSASLKTNDMPDFGVPPQ